MNVPFQLRSKKHQKIIVKVIVLSDSSLPSFFLRGSWLTSWKEEKRQATSLTCDVVVSIIVVGHVAYQL